LVDGDKSLETREFQVSYDSRVKQEARGRRPRDRPANPHAWDRPISVSCFAFLQGFHFVCRSFSHH